MSTPIRDWIGGGGDFSDPSQWSDPGANMGNPPASPPGASDTAVFDMGGSVDIAASVTNLVAQVNSGVTLNVATGGYDVTGIAGDIFGLIFNNSGSRSDGDLTVTGAGTMSTYGIMGTGFGLNVTNSAAFLDSAMSTFAGGTTLQVSNGGEFIGSDLNFGGIPSTDDAMIVNHAGVTLDDLDADQSGDGLIAINLTDGGLDLGNSGVAGTLTLNGASILSGFGTIENGGGGGLEINIDPGAEIDASGGLLDLDGTVNHGEMTIDAASILALLGTVDAGVNVTFSDTTGGLDLDAPTNFGGTVFDFGDHNTIELIGLVSDSDYNGSAASGTLTLDLEDGTTVDIQFHGDYTLGSFQITPDAESDTTDITFVPCFVAGTRIRTTAGEVAVENLAEGDMVLTASGRCAPITWLGHRHVDCAAHHRPRDVMPVRVAPHAFASDQPSRPLWLSPDHAVFIDGVLIPIRHLINGTAIAQQHVDTVTYWHVELPRHDVLLAEGLPVESYLDTGNRFTLVDDGDAVPLADDFATWVRETEACAPVVVVGPVLETVRARLSRFLEAVS